MCLLVLYFFFLGVREFEFIFQWVLSEDRGVVLVRVYQEFREGVVCFDVGVDVDVIIDVYLYLYLVFGFQFYYGVFGERGWFGLFFKKLEERGDGFVIFDQIELQVSSVDGGVDCEVVDFGYLVGEFVGGGVVVFLFVYQYVVEGQGCV